MKNINLIIIKSIKQNILFIISLFTMILFLSLRYSYNIFNCFLSLYVVTSIGYFIHIYSHTISHTKLYLKFYKSNNIISKFFRRISLTIHKINLYILYYVVDFHKNIHHNSKINKIWYNVIFEFLQNMFFQSIGLIIINTILKPKIYLFNIKFEFYNIIFLFWGLLYSTIHLINYEIIKSDSHIEHHINHNYNFGLLWEDIIYKTQINVDTIDNINHGSIN